MHFQRLGNLILRFFICKPVAYKVRILWAIVNVAVGGAMRCTGVDAASVSKCAVLGLCLGGFQGVASGT